MSTPNPTRVTGPLELSCRACFSKPGEACTTATDTGQRKVTWVHGIRTDDATCTCEDCAARRQRLLG